METGAWMIAAGRFLVPLGFFMGLVGCEAGPQGESGPCAGNAAPVIDRVTVAPDPVMIGTTATLTVAATDTDTLDYSVVASGIDVAEGTTAKTFALDGVSAGTVSLTVLVSDGCAVAMQSVDVTVMDAPPSNGNHGGSCLAGDACNGDLVCWQGKCLAERAELINTRLVYGFDGDTRLSLDPSATAPIKLHDLYGPFGYMASDPAQGAIRRWRMKGLYWDENCGNATLQFTFDLAGAVDPVFTMPRVAGGWGDWTAENYSSWFQFGNGSAGATDKSHGALYADVLGGCWAAVVEMWLYAYDVYHE